MAFWRFGSWGLAVVVPVIEEFFLRGFVMRFVIDADWWKVPFGTLTPAAVAVGTLLPRADAPGRDLRGGRLVYARSPG